MRPIWNGSISFGLLNVPVQLFSATRDLDLHFRMLDGRDKKPIRYERVNAETGDEVPWKEIVKAYKVKKGSFLVVDEKEIKKAAPEQTETIDIEAFCERCAIDPIYFEKPYYLVPGKKAEKGYVLLREALADSGKVGIARVVIRTRQYLAALVPEGEALMLTLMRFAQEVVEPKALGLSSMKQPKISATELDMAKKLLESMTVDWKPDAYKDEFRTKLRQILEKKAKKGSTVKAEKPEPEPAEKKGEVIDLVSILQKSLGKGAAKTTSKSGKKTTTRRAASARRTTPRRRHA